MGGGEFPPENNNAATGDIGKSHRRKPSRWDEPPPAFKTLTGGGGGGGGTTNLPGPVPGVAGMFPTMIPFGQVQLPACPLMPMQAMTRQATRFARRVYVGGLPPTANELSIAVFFSHALAAIGGNTAGPGDAVVNVYLNQELRFAFVEMRTVEEASNAMALDGITLEGTIVKVRRASDYNPSLAAVLGPSQPNPNLNLAAVGLGFWSVRPEGPDRIFVGGLPYYFTEAQVRELLESFGPLRGFEFVKDRETGNSKGYAFCTYQDPSVTDIVCMALNGIKMGDRTLSVRRADQDVTQPTPKQDNVILHVAFQKLNLDGTPSTTLPTKVVCLLHTATPNNGKYEDLMAYIRQEAKISGGLMNIVTPCPVPVGGLPEVGKVFLEFADSESSSRARNALSSGGRQVLAFYFPEDKFARRDYTV